MMWQVMLYAIAVASAVSVMGYCEERLAVMRDIPRRWVWPLTMVISVLWVAGAMLWSGPADVAPTELAVVVTPAGELQVEAVADSEGPAAIAVDVPPTWAITAWSAPADQTLLTVWAGVSILLLLSLLCASFLLQKRSARWRPDKVLGREVLVSEFTGPALIGIWRPRIVVPEWFMAETSARQELILRHEEQHIAARDPLLLRAATLLTLALPWNLPLWWQLRRMRQAIEIDCDARVLRSGASPAEYGSVLVAVTQRCASVPAGLIAMSEPVSALERRIRNFVPDPARHSMWRAVAALSFWMLGIGAAASLEAPPLPQRQERARKSAPPTQSAQRQELQQAPEPAAPGMEATREDNAADLPRLRPPEDLGEVPSRREAIERAIVEHHPELVTGPEREGTAFVSLRLRQDSSVESSELRFVEPSDTAGLAAANAPAMEGRLLLAPGWQIAGGATVKCQIVVRYLAAAGNRVSAGRLEYRSFAFEDAARVAEHYLPGAFSEAQRATGAMPWLILSRDGRVLRSGFLAPDVMPTTLQAQLPNMPLSETRIMGASRGGNSSLRMLALAWVEE